MSHAREAIDFDERIPVVREAGALYVYGRHETKEIRGGSVCALYERLEPYLRAGCTEQEILEAVPASHQDAVRSLLAALRETALLSRPPAGSATWGPMLDGARPSGKPVRFVIRGRPVDVYVDGPSAVPEGNAVVSVLTFAGKDAAARLLLDIREDGDIARPWTCIVVVEEEERHPLGASEREHRLFVARWLTASTFSPGDKACQLLVFEWRGRTGTLSRRARVSVGSAAHPLSSLLTQLNVVNLTKAPQLPLVTATASHPFFRPTVSSLGLRHQEVGRTAAAKFLGACCGPADPGEPAPLTAVESSRGLAEATVVERLLGSAGPSGRVLRMFDALELVSRHPDILYLQRILRLRRARLPVRRVAACPGIYRLECNDPAVSAVSLSSERALAELLAKVIWRDFYAGERLDGVLTMALPHHSFLDGVQLERRLRRVMRNEAARGLANVAASPFRVWGTTLWMASSGGAPMEERFSGVRSAGSVS